MNCLWVKWVDKCGVPGRRCMYIEGRDTSSSGTQELKKANFTQTAIPPVLYCQRSHAVPGPVSGTGDTGVNKRDSGFSQAVLRWRPPCRRLIRLQGAGAGVKPVILLYGFPNTGPRFSTKPPGICILRPISDDSRRVVRISPMSLWNVTLAPFYFPRAFRWKILPPSQLCYRGTLRPESLKSSDLPCPPRPVR